MDREAAGAVYGWHIIKLTVMTDQARIFRTIEDIQARRKELRGQLHASSELIGDLWTELSKESKPSSRGEMVTSIISKSITAFDAFMLARKLVTQYGHIFRRRKK